ncbi:MAG: hypothetical protein V4502_11140 [Pseudomonadota bacterium]
MALRNGTPLRHIPSGVCDAVDGTNAHAGAMAALANLIPDPSTRGVYVPRPAATLNSDFTAGGTFANAGFISEELVVGDLAYGMIASSRNAGKDEPYCRNLATGAFVTVSGVTAANTPTSPAPSGDWTPPILAAVGGRIIVTHPGFPGGSTKFGWFDISGLSIATTGDTVINTPVIFGAPNVLGVQPKVTITGVGIPASTLINSTIDPLTNATVIVGTVAVGSPILTVTSSFGAFMAIGSPVYSSAFPIGTTSAQNGNVAGPTIQLSQNSTVTGTVVAIFDIQRSTLGPVANVGATHSNTTLDTITFGTTGMFVGMGISGLGIPPGTTIAAITGPNSLTLSQAASTTATTNFNVAGSYVVMSANATATADAVALAIAGGTKAAPLWGAGDTAGTPLPSAPVGVAQMNGRAWYALGTDGVVFSDSGLPCQVSNSLAVQALTTGDGLAVTALGPLLLSAPLTGGIVQGLIAFQGATKMQQITGDQATGNLAMNALPVATGTLAPLSITPTQVGLAFVSPQGLRFVRFDGSVTDPIGEGGTGITIPFINSVVPSRMCAAANDDTVRITTQNGAVDGNPQQEWWYDLTRKEWSGPHSSAASLIQPWRSSFLVSLAGVNAMLWQSDAHQSSASVYRENGTDLETVGTTALLPDSGGMNMNAIIEAALACQLADDRPLTVTITEERGQVLDTLTILPPGTFGQAQDGLAVLGPGYFAQRRLAGSVPWVFKQCKFSFAATAGPNARLGNLYMRYQKLGYALEDVA